MKTSTWDRATKATRKWMTKITIITMKSSHDSHYRISKIFKNQQRSQINLTIYHSNFKIRWIWNQEWIQMHHRLILTRLTLRQRSHATPPQGRDSRRPGKSPKMQLGNGKRCVLRDQSLNHNMNTIQKKLWQMTNSNSFFNYIKLKMFKTSLDNN